VPKFVLHSFGTYNLVSGFQDFMKLGFDGFDKLKGLGFGEHR
jgi:hypothetical protein